MSFFRSRDFPLAPKTVVTSSNPNEKEDMFIIPLYLDLPKNATTVIGSYISKSALVLRFGDIVIKLIPMYRHGKLHSFAMGRFSIMYFPCEW